MSQARPYEELLVLITAAGRVVTTGHYLLAAGPRDSTRLAVSTTAPGLLARLTCRATRKQQDARLERLALQLT